jgi:hypothetical protein
MIIVGLGFSGLVVSGSGSGLPAAGLSCYRPPVRVFNMLNQSLLVSKPSKPLGPVAATTDSGF